MRIHGTRACATTLAIAGSASPPDTSLTTVAPASSTASATVARVDAAVLAGVDPGRIVLDPGLGFAKTAAHNWALLRRLDVLLALGFPLLVGASRKRFLGQLLADDDGVPRPPDGREVAAAAITALVATAGAWGVRVHDVASSMDAVAVATAIQLGAAPAPARPRTEP